MAAIAPEKPGDEDAQWRTAGDRIQALLDASAAGGAVARERAEQLVREVTDLYGAGLERMLGMAVEPAIPNWRTRFAADDLVASLLLVHGLHPHGVERRIEDALDSVRPYLGSHGGDVSCSRSTDEGGRAPAVRRAAARAARRRRSPSSWPSRTRCGRPRPRSPRSKWWPRNRTPTPRGDPG